MDPFCAQVPPEPAALRPLRHALGCWLRSAELPEQETLRGRGLSIIAVLVDDLHIHRAPGGTAVRMVAHLPPCRPCRHTASPP